MKKSYLLLVLLCLSFTGCKDKQKTAIQTTDISAHETEVQTVKQENQPEEEVQSVFTSDNELNLSQFTTQAHEKYLSDPLIFDQIPDQGITEGNTAVVGSRVCRIFPRESFDFTDINSAIIKGDYDTNATEVPFGSLVQITGPKLLNASEDINDYGQKMFAFEENYNWFYPAQWNGIQGYIFGADLYGLGRSLEENKISAHLYKTNGKFENFYPYTGYTSLNQNVEQSLVNNKLAVKLAEKERWSYYPDDMVSKYQSIRNDATMFITTDLISHCQHLIFDKLLQHIEEEEFVPRLTNLCSDFIESLKGDDEISAAAVDYFTVPYLLLKSAPVKQFDSQDSWRKTIVYKETDITDLYNSSSSRVQADYDSVISASGDFSQVLEDKEDFSQYKARGHYTKNGILTAYFMAQMWFGRINWVIADDYPSSSKMAHVITYIIDTVHKNPKLYNDWNSLFESVTALIGESDDVSFSDILPLWQQFEGDRTDAFSFMKTCHDKLRPPRISSNSVFDGPHEGESHKSPMGWRFMGQRFVYDSYIHNELSAPRLFERDFVSGLDILKVFGSKSADYILSQSEYDKIPGFKDKITELEQQFNNEDSGFWTKNYYNTVLYQVKTQANFAQGSQFYFTESPAWNVKSLNAGLGTWAELRHDTILYAKQSYAERAGDGDFDPTFRTEKLPVPVNYVEPNVPFWEGSLLGVQILEKTLDAYSLIDSEGKYALQALKSIYEKCLVIAQKEAQDTDISEDENKWIRTIPNILAKYILLYTDGDWFEDKDQFKMACIADVFTNTEHGVCLETGVGRPNELYIPLNDNQGGKRIAIGYGFSYYEFYHPMGDRLTDEQWKAIVYDGDDDMSKYIPHWAQSCIIK